MPPHYVIVLDTDGSQTTRDQIDFSDDVTAVIAARRLFVEKLVFGPAHTVSLKIGRTRHDGEVDWLDGWLSRI